MPIFFGAPVFPFLNMVRTTKTIMVITYGVIFIKYGLISKPYVCNRGPKASRKPNNKAPNAVLKWFPSTKNY